VSFVKLCNLINVVTLLGYTIQVIPMVSSPHWNIRQ